MDEPRRGRGVGRALEAFANAVLERTLPRIRQWLALRLGPRAELAGLELDGARVHLVDARIPLGPRAILHASRATFVTRAEHLALGLPPVRLETLEGRVELPSTTASVTLDGAPEHGADEWISGRVTLRDLSIAGRAYEGTAVVWLTSERFAIENARLADVDGSSSLRVKAGGTFDGGELRVTHARADADATPIAAFLEAIAALRGADLPRVPLHSDARVSGHCELSREGSLSAALSATGGDARAELAIDGSLEQGALRGAAHGHVDPALIALAGIGIGGVPVAFEAALGGTIRQPRVELTGRSPELALRSSPESDPLTISRVRGSLTFDERAALDVRARTGRGSIAVSYDGALQLKIERAELGAALSFLPPRAAAIAERLALDRGELWLDVRTEGEAIEGVAHVESPRASVTLDPLRLIRSTRTVEHSALRAHVDARTLHDSMSGMVDLSLAIERASPSEVRADGSVSARQVEIVLGEREPVAMREAQARIEVRDARMLITGARARAFDGSISGAATVTWSGGRPRVVVGELVAESLREPLARWALSRRSIELMPGLSVSGALARRDGALRGELSASTPRSAASIRVVMSDEGSLRGSQLEGTLAIADVAPFFARWTMQPVSSAVWRLTGTFDGTIAAPRLDLDGRCDRQPVRVIGEHATIELVAEEVRTLARATRDRVVWSELVARTYGGTLRSRGSAAYDGAASARLELDDARAEMLPLTGGRVVGAYLEGALSGTLDVWRTSGDTTIGCGRLRVVDPEHRFVARAAAFVERVGLPLPDGRGVEALVASVKVHRGGWHFTEVSARVRQVRVRGDIEVRRDGSLDGRLSAHPEASWLSASSMLAPFASLLDEVPVQVSGSLSAPRFSADAWDAADGVLARSAFGRRVRAILVELAPDALARPSRADGRRGHGTASLLTTDALLDRLARDPENTELFEALIERGLRADEIAAGVAKRR